MPMRFAKRLTALSGVSMALLLAALPGAAAEDQWPLLRPGQWEFKTDVNGQRRLEISCSDPIADVKASVLELDQRNCDREPVRKRSGGYVFRVECPAEQGAKGKMKGAFRLTTTSDSAFKMESISTIDGKVRREIVEAKRRGDCSQQ